MKKDDIFKSCKYSSAFKFDESVADVFEDMLNRSIPLYYTMQHLILKFSEAYSSTNDLIVDLGCSHGFTCLQLAANLKRRIIGIDSSRPMIEKAVSNLTLRNDIKGSVEFMNLEISPETICRFNDAKVFILSLTLQFIIPQNREEIINTIFFNLKNNGILILIEKTTLPHSVLNETFINFYHDFKESNGYSKTEIASKRKSIENVLIPFSLEKNVDMLYQAGFREVTTFVQWLNFSGIIAIK